MNHKEEGHIYEKWKEVNIGINLHGLTIAETIDTLLEKWSNVLFIDIYDWYDGVSEHGIDLSMPV